DRVLRIDVFAEREAAALPGVVTTERLPLHPLRLWIGSQQVGQLRGERGRGNRLREDPEAGALLRQLRGHDSARGRGERTERTNLPEVDGRAGSVGIVEAEDRRLREEIGRPA